MAYAAINRKLRPCLDGCSPAVLCEVCKHRIALKKSYQKNKEKYKFYRDNHKLERTQALRKWSADNSEHKKNHNRLWRQKNKAALALRHKNWEATKMMTDSVYRLKKRIRACITNGIARNYGAKASRTVDLLGCSFEVLREHLERQFQPGMTWENYGQFGWHIDHIRPLAAFDLRVLEQQKEACNYKNLQPLWWQDNLSKGSRGA